jgi:hypothetical protein
VLRKIAVPSLVVGIFLCSALGLLACGDNDVADTDLFIRGWVLADGPVSGAQVTMLDRDGNPIDGATDTTFETGTFALPVQDAPLEFTVVATGGLMNGQAFAGTLRATEVDFHAATDSAVVTLGTTLATAYRERAGGKPEEADAAVRTFLTLPDDIHLGEGLRSETAYFGAKAFLSDALSGGGVDTFIANLADEMTASQPQARTYPGVAKNDPLLVTAITFAGSNLAQGGLQWAGFHTMPLSLEHFGVETAPTPQELRDQITALSTQLEDTRRELNQ